MLFQNEGACGPAAAQTAPAPGGGTPCDTLEEERREVLDAALAALRSARSAADRATARRLIEHLAAQPDRLFTSTERRSR